MAWIAYHILQLLLTMLGTLAQSNTEEIRVPPSIVSPTERQELVYVANNKVEVKCSATGQPAPLYKWLLNDTEIKSEQITFSSSTGVLTFLDITPREEGLFVCYAKNTFSNGMTATAVSALLEIRVARLDTFPKRYNESYTGTEGNYVMIRCDENLPKYYGAITFKWYAVHNQKNQEIFPDERKFIDQGGNLHFTYALESDGVPTSPYKCALSSVQASTIQIGSNRSLIITSTGPIANSAPKLQYSTTDSFLTVEVGKTAQLECVFSGYIASNILSETVPKVAWYDQDGRAITQGGRYDLVSNGRTLTIMTVTEDDEKTYRCRGTNSLGSAEGSLVLNVTSRPIWVQHLESTTVVEGKDAVFHCVTRSAKGEQSPNKPRWSLNTNPMGSTYDPNKYQFNADKTMLTVKSVNKDKDIACFQCSVDNSVGAVQDDGCVTVIKPIEIKVRPAAEQTVMKGDVVDLTVVASTDPLYAPNMTYSWIFKNVTYRSDKAPPYVTYDLINNRAYINTSTLTDENFKRIGGLYRRVISHPVEAVHIDVTVKIEIGPLVETVATVSFDYWIVGLIIGIIFIIIVLLLVICVICHRKMQEGAYPVDKKETAAGLDPEKELKDSGFHDLSRADYDEFPAKQTPLTFDFDDIPVEDGNDESFSEYGEEPTKFNEDGSFIGVYSKEIKKPPRQRDPTESKV